jgi:hypothetical protein
MALHLTDRGARVIVKTKWPVLFEDLPVEVSAKAEGDWRPAAFSPRHTLDGPYAQFAGLDQFSICCRRAGIDEAVDLDIRWKVRNRALCRSIRRDAAGRKIVVFQPRKLASELTPERAAIEAWLDQCTFFRVRVGSPVFVHTGEGSCDLDLYGRTMPSDLVDIAVEAGDVFFGELCYLHILADALRKPSVCMLPRSAAESPVWKHLNATRLFRHSQLASVVYAG